MISHMYRAIDSYISRNNSRKTCYRDDTRANVDKLKPFTLYQFKVRAIRHGANQTSLYSESIECYTNEDGENSIDHHLMMKQ